LTYPSEDAGEMEILQIKSGSFSESSDKNSGKTFSG
jgi:hypothetical protein